ncbi:hypothetical protein VTO42DRAFT_8054 [Malbranchea cinnamomea]
MIKDYAAMIKATSGRLIGCIHSDGGREFINESLTRRSRHIEIRFHLLRDLVLKGEISLQHIASTANLADGLTKPLARDLFKEFQVRLVSGPGRVDESLEPGLRQGGKTSTMAALLLAITIGDVSGSEKVLGLLPTPTVRVYTWRRKQRSGNRGIT